MSDNQTVIASMEVAFQDFVNRTYAAVLSGEKKVEDFGKER